MLSARIQWNVARYPVYYPLRDVFISVSYVCITRIITCEVSGLCVVWVVFKAQAAWKLLRWGVGSPFSFSFSLKASLGPFVHIEERCVVDFLVLLFFVPVLVSFPLPRFFWFFVFSKKGMLYYILARTRSWLFALLLNFQIDGENISCFSWFFPEKKQRKSRGKLPSILVALSRESCEPAGFHD